LRKPRLVSGICESKKRTPDDQIIKPLKKQLGIPGLFTHQIREYAKSCKNDNGVQEIPAETFVPFFQQRGSEGFFTIQAKLVHLQYI
jgi:hypothetical protein